MNNKELDAHLAARVMKWQISWARDQKPWFKTHDGTELFSTGEYDAVSTANWSPSTDIRATWDLVEQLREQGYVVFIKADQIGNNRDAKYTVAISRSIGRSNTFRSDAFSIEMAICKAASKI